MAAAVDRFAKQMSNSMTIFVPIKKVFYEELHDETASLQTYVQATWVHMPMAHLPSCTTSRESLLPHGSQLPDCKEGPKRPCPRESWQV